MAGQMNRLIEASHHQKDEEWEKLCEEIEDYIEECGYTRTLNAIIEQYHKRKRGKYISFTAKKIS